MKKKGQENKERDVGLINLARPVFFKWKIKNIYYKKHLMLI